MVEIFSAMNSAPISFENCQVLFKNQHVTENNSPPAVSVTSEVSIVSSDDSLCGDNIQVKKKQGLKVQNDYDRIQGTRKRSVSETQRPIRLLAQPHEDKIALHPLHAFIRQQIEVFTVEKKDMDQPAPGRKNPIRLHQVGLRCIHCRDTPHKAKRAVCYPTSVGRVYNAVSDMKFDHFSRCTSLPDTIRTKLQLLREDQQSLKVTSKKKKKKRSSSQGSFTSTAQYYHDSAISMGMIDRDGVVYMMNECRSIAQDSLMKHSGVKTQKSHHESQGEPASKRMKRTIIEPESLHRILLQSQLLSLLSTRNSLSLHSPRIVHGLSPLTESSVHSENKRLTSPLHPQKHTPVHKNNTVITSRPKTSRNDTILLSSPQDEQHLNDIHCFIRKQVEVFSATMNDVNAPAPGRRQRIVLGQVGIRCIHCALLPVQNRVKRAVCYPPSTKGIYHAVSNMKFDHFTVCQQLPSNVRNRFDQLYSNEKRRKTRVGRSKGSRSSPMAQFYVESASKLGLVDSDTGIRFRSRTSSFSDNINDMTGMSALMLAATDPSIREAYFQAKACPGK